MWDKGAERRQEDPPSLWILSDHVWISQTWTVSRQLHCYVYRHLCTWRSHAGAWYKADLYMHYPHKVFLSPSLPTHIQGVRIPELHRSQTGGFLLQQMSDPGFLTSVAPLRPHKLYFEQRREEKHWRRGDRMREGHVETFQEQMDICVRSDWRGCLLRGSNYSNGQFSFYIYLSLLFVQFPVFILYCTFQIYQYPWVMCCPAEKRLHILVTLPLAFRRAFFYSCSEFYMFKQACMLPAPLHYSNPMKFSVSVKYADALPLHAHCLMQHQFSHLEVTLWQPAITVYHCQPDILHTFRILHPSFFPPFFFFFTNFIYFVLLLFN